MKVSREHLELAEPTGRGRRSTGVANAATGERGDLAARATAAEAARLLDLSCEEVLVLSTGVIGKPLPLHRGASRPQGRVRRPVAGREGRPPARS